MDKNKISLHYLNKEEMFSDKYASFYELFHGEGSFNNNIPRIKWYLSSPGYKILVATINGEYVGQSCAYRARAIINNVEQDLWWGVDSFVLKELRGKGIGKLMQSKLHMDCSNFSSAWYSPVNGIIKKKCGANKLMPVRFHYYPISRFFSLLAELILRKIFSRSIVISPIRFDFLYYRLLSLFCHLRPYKLEFVEFSIQENLSQLSLFMESNLKHKSFHIIRSEDYLRWKYLDNPTMKFHALKVLSNNEMMGVVIFSEIAKSSFVGSKATLFKIYDCISVNEKELPLKILILQSATYYKLKGNNIDGLLSLQDIPFIKITYPKAYLLSTMDSKGLSNGYLTYLDQDMDRL